MSRNYRYELISMVSVGAGLKETSPYGCPPLVSHLGGPRSGLPPPPKFQHRTWQPAS